MKKRRIAFPIVAVSSLAIALSAWSGEDGVGTSSQQKVFNALDANGDGRVTEKEFVITGLHEIFKSFDLDGNGKVSRKEFMKATKGHKIDHKAEWAAMSRGADEISFKDSLRNKVAVAEMRQHFRKVDKRGRGYVTMRDLD